MKNPAFITVRLIGPLAAFLCAAAVISSPLPAQSPAAAKKEASGAKAPAAKNDALTPGGADQGKGADRSPSGRNEAPKPGDRGEGAPQKPSADKKTAAPADPAVKAAETGKKKAEWITRTLEFGISKERREAIGMMLTIKDEAAKQQMTALLLKTLKTETDQEVIVKAIIVGGDLKAAELGPEFMRFLDDETEDVRIAAASGIQALAYAPAKDALVRKLKAQDLSKDSNFTDSVIRTLADFKAVEVREFAEAGIKDLKTTPNLREGLILFIGKCGIRESKDFLVTILKNQDENLDIRSYAASSLSLMGVKEAAADIGEVLKSIEAMPFKKRKDHYNLYLYCVAALVRLGDDGAFPRLMDSLKSDNAMVRLKAIRLMKDLKDKRTIDILKYKRDYDPSPVVQKGAREALDAMGVTDTKDSVKPSEKAAEKPAVVPANGKVRDGEEERPDTEKPAPDKR